MKRLTYQGLIRINELEETYPDADWFAILADGGIEAVEEYADYLTERTQQTDTPIGITRQKGMKNMKNQQKRFHVLTWDYDSGEDDKGDFHVKTRAVQEMRLFVESCGHDGAAVIDRNTKQAVAVYGDYPRFQ